MRAVDLARIVAGSAAIVACAATVEASAEEPCAHLIVGGDLASAWTAPVEALRAQIAELPRSDCQPMMLSIERSDRGVRVVATTPDGRRAERTVQDPSALVATALGLLVTIPDEAAPAPPPAPPVAAVPSTATAPPAVSHTPAPAARPAVGLWAGFSAGVRLTAPTDLTVLDVEARADSLFEHWMLLATIRSAVASCLGEQGVDCDVYNDVSVGLGVGRRIRTGASAVDLALEPSLVVMHMEYDSPSGGEAQSVDGSLVAFRLDASARLAIPLGDSWNITLTVDAGLAPALLLSPTRLEPQPGTVGASPPPFPAWVGGVRLGASGVLL